MSKISTWIRAFTLSITCGLLALPATAAVITVTTSSTPGCTLADAIRAANANAARGDCPAGSGADTIRIAPALIEITSELPMIDSTITIVSADAGTKTLRRTAEQSNQFRVLDVDNGSLTLRRIEVSGGYLRGILDGGGAGVRVRNGSLTLDQVVIRDNELINTSDGGGGIRAISSTLTIADSLITDNRIVSDNGNLIRGAAIRVSNSPVSITRSTMTANHLEGLGGVFYFFNSQVNVSDSYFGYRTNVSTSTARNTDIYLSIAGNSTATFTNTTMTEDRGPGDKPSIYANDSVLTFRNSTLDEFEIDVSVESSNTVNFINTLFQGICVDDITVNQVISSFFEDDSCTGSASPGGVTLFPAADNGGPTWTQRVHPLSSTIDAGDNGQCPPSDQRGLSRINGCDIGAFEFVENVDVQVAVVVLTPPPYYVGQIITANLNIYNDGPSDASYPQIDLALNNLSLLSVDGACQSIPCPIAALIAGAPFRTITVQLTPVSSLPGNFTLTASAGPSVVAFNDLNPANNSASASRSITAAADTRITKTLLTPGPYSVGQTINYQLLAENSGPASATSVVITDTPEGLDINSITNCSNQPAGPCNFAIIGPGGSLLLNVSAEITATRFDNTAQVSQSTFDPNPANNIDDRFNGGSAEAATDVKLALLRQSSPPFINGQVVDYLVRIGNTGPAPATDVRMQFDAENFFVTGVSNNCGPNQLPCEIGSLSVGQSVDVLVQGLLQFSGPVTIEASVQAAQSDPQLANNVANDGFTAVQAADVLLSLTLLSQPPIYRGQDIRYRMNISNFGGDDADQVVISTSAQNLQIQSAVGANCLSLPCTIDTLGLLETETIEVTAQATQSGSFDLSASVSADQLDPVPANNTDSTGNSGTALEPTNNFIFADGLESPQ